jgi:hypothetical protein
VSICHGSPPPLTPLIGFAAPTKGPTTGAIVLNVRTGIPPELAADPWTIRATARTVPANKLSTLLIFPSSRAAPLKAPDRSGASTTPEPYEREGRRDSRPDAVRG